MSNKTAALASCLVMAAVPAFARAEHHGAGADGPTGATGVTGATGPTGPGEDEHGKGRHKGEGPGKHEGRGNRCKHDSERKAWIVSGTYGPGGSFTATKNADGSYSGSVNFTVSHTNHHAKGATGPFTFTNAKVKFDSPTATAPAATDKVRLQGKIVVVKKGCTSPDAGKVTIRRIRFSAPEAAGTGKD